MTQGDYIRRRDALIPEAEARANQKWGKACRGTTDQAHERYAAGWNRTFHQTMNRLAKEAGL